MSELEDRGLAVLTKAIGEARAQRAAASYRDLWLPRAEAATYRLSGRGRRSRAQLAGLRNAYRGERCYIIGNGPSLKDTDLSLVSDSFTFTLNRGYLLFDRLGGPSTFLVAVNQHVVRQFGNDLLAAGSTTFISWRARKYLPADANVTYVRRARRFTFSSDPAVQGAWEGATVTYLALQLAYHLGFTEVVLLGVDHSFSTTGPANKLMTSSGSDPNHFDPNYFGAGVQWQLPDLETSQIAYRLARTAFEADGRSVFDATVGGKLDVFPKTTLATMVERGMTPARSGSPAIG